MSNIPTIEPSSVTAGDTIQWSRSLPDYPATAGWVLNYSLLSLAGSIKIGSFASGDAHLVNIPAGTSKDYTPGSYNWQSWVTNGTERHPVARGTIEIQPDYATADAGTDTRSHVKRMLDAIEATLEGTATTDQQELQIDGTIIKRRSVAELLDLRQRYLNLYHQELAAQERINSGSGYSRIRQVIPR